jgi:hypothetical protein
MGELPWGFKRDYTMLGQFMCQVLAMISAGTHFMITEPKKPPRKLPRKMRRATRAA